MAHRRRRHTRSSDRPPLRRPVSVIPSVVAAVVIVYALVMGPAHARSLAGLASGETRLATVATDVLNVRSGPSTDAAVVGRWSEGRRVEVIGPMVDGFAPVRVGADRAWVAATWLAFDDGMPVVTDAPKNDGAKIGVAVAAAAPDSATRARESAPAIDAEVPPTVPPERWIDIDRSEATVTLYEGETAIATFVGKIGRDRSADGFYATAIGTFHVFSMNKGLAPTPFAEDTYLTDWVGFDPVRKNGIHSPVRDAGGNVKAWQNPTTLGCVRLSAEDAEAVFAFARIGMRVEVHD